MDAPSPRNENDYCQSCSPANKVYANIETHRPNIAYQSKDILKAENCSLHARRIYGEIQE